MRARIGIAVVVLAVLSVAAWWMSRDNGQRPGLAPAGIEREGGAKSDELALADAVETHQDTKREAVDAVPVGPPGDRFVPTHRLVGRVVDGRRWPVEGAQVTFDDAESTESRGGGRFELSIVRSEGELGDSGVVARDAEGRCARGAVHLTPGDGTDPVEVDLGTLILDGCFALRVGVSEAGAPAPQALVQVGLGHGRQPAGEHRVDASGELVLEALPRGPVYLTATLPGRRAHARAFVPEESEVAVALEVHAWWERTRLAASCCSSSPRPDRRNGAWRWRSPRSASRRRA